MGNELILKSRIESPDGAYYVYCLRLDLARKNVAEVHVIAGDHHELASQALNAELSEFVSWLKNMEFNGKRDESRTYDLARYFEKQGKNPEWIDHLCGILRVGDLSGLQYELSQDFEIALGHKDLIMQFDLAEYVPPASSGTGGGTGARQEDLSGLIPLSFVVSPFAGTPLVRLTPGDRIHVRFAKPKDGRSSNYLKRMNIQAVDGRYESDVVLKSLGTRPGKGDVLLKFKLEGGAEGFIIEENQDIRVKMADTGKARRGSSAMDREAPGIVGGPLALVLLLVAFVSVFGLLYVFVF
jgi:hypothetical protein